VAWTAEGFAFLRMVREILEQAQQTASADGGVAPEPSASAHAGT